MWGLDAAAWSVVGLVSLVITGVAGVVSATAGYCVWHLQTLESQRLEKERAEVVAASATANALAARSALELEKMKAPRSMSVEAQARARITLAQYAGTRFTVTTYLGDSEASAFAGTIQSVLEGAGWRPSSPLGGNMTPASGVRIMVRPTANSSTQAAAESLASAIRSEGISVSPVARGSGAWAPSIDIDIRVASKP